MTRIGTIPLYHETNDRRVIKYLQRNIITHQLQNGVSVANAVTYPKGNGNIRTAFGMIALLWIFSLLMVGWFG